MRGFILKTKQSKATILAIHDKTLDVELVDRANEPHSMLLPKMQLEVGEKIDVTYSYDKSGVRRVYFGKQLNEPQINFRQRKPRKARTKPKPKTKRNTPKLHDGMATVTAMHERTVDVELLGQTKKIRRTKDTDNLEMGQQIAVQYVYDNGITAVLF